MMQLLMFGVALLAAATFTRWVRDYSIARGWTSTPSLDRHVHTRPIPRLGGVAIFLTLWCMVLVAHWLPGHFGTNELIFPHLTIKILGPATIIFLLGLADDFCGVNAYVKFAVEAGAAGLLFCNGFGISHLSLLAGYPHLGWLVGLPLTILWVLWITNAFNLIDGLDGLAAGSALFSTLVNCVLAVLFHNEGILILTLVLAGAIAGFLRYNFNPASVFLGDCGSLLIGFLLGCFGALWSEKSVTLVALTVPILAVSIPLADVALSIARRFVRNRPIFQGDRGHIHHKLLDRGFSPKGAVLMIYGLCGLAAGASLLVSALHNEISGFMVILFCAVAWIGVQQLGY